jgi:hypothetical protein
LEDLGEDGKIISQWIFKKYDERVWPVFMWLKMWIRGWLMWTMQ